MSAAPYLREFNKKINKIEVIGGIKIKDEIKIIGEIKIIKEIKKIIINFLVFN